MAFFGGLPVAGSGRGRILRDVKPPLLNHAVEVKRRRQAFFGGLSSDA